MKLRCENLVKKYGPRTVVKGVSMEVNQGEIVGFLGPNGAGKTTSFYMITGLIVPNEGRIFLDDEEITKLPMFKRSQKGVGYLAQEASVFRHMTVEDNIMSVMEMSKQFTKEERKQRLEDLLDEFNLHKVRKSKGIQLSGGERRRCEIARALAIDPKFILLDEPFAGVDPIAVEDIQYIIAKLKYKNIGVIITDHNVGETLAIIDRAYLLYEGSILQSGTPEALAADDEVRTKYLGSNFTLKRSAAFLRAEQGGPQRINTQAEHDAVAEAVANVDETSNVDETPHVAEAPTDATLPAEELPASATVPAEELPAGVTLPAEEAAVEELPTDAILPAEEAPAEIVEDVVAEYTDKSQEA